MVSLVTAPTQVSIIGSSPHSIALKKASVQYKINSSLHSLGQAEPAFVQHFTVNAPTALNVSTVSVAQTTEGSGVASGSEASHLVCFAS
jgi:hypothetical protein